MIGKVERNLWYTKARRALGPEIQRIENPTTVLAYMKKI